MAGDLTRCGSGSTWKSAEKLPTPSQHRPPVEIDGDLAHRLTHRLAGTNVTVEHADATALPYADATFSGAVSFTMLHHVPSADQQDQLLREIRRVLRPGATFAGSDSRPSLVFRLAHVADTMTLVEPDGFADRLCAAGFERPQIESASSAFRFRAHVPAAVSS